MQLTVLPHGMIDSNTYILSDNSECAVIDCGVKARDILTELQRQKLKVKYILLTHGHLDHIFHALELKEQTGATLCLHEDEKELYLDPQKNGMALFGMRWEMKLAEPDILLKDGQKLSLGASELEIIHTPGHTPGGISILCGKMLFTGDTLFSLSVGRTDLYGGSSQKLNHSVTGKLFTLEADTVVYPGHGPSTTIGFERENNPYV